MRAAHHGCRQSRAALFAGLLASCSAAPEQDTIWPPADFEVCVEEARGDQLVRRFRVRADGLACFATATGSVRDAETSVQLPVYDRACVYRLVPTCTRALARRIHRAGILELDAVQGERGTREATTLTLRWQAFGQRRLVTARGRVHGAMAEILAIAGAHLPAGEAFELPGVAERALRPVLRGVPAPLADAGAGLDALLEVSRDGPADGPLLLDAFALACRTGRRSDAEDLLRRWSELCAGELREQQVFPAEGPRLTPEVLTRMLPAASPR